MAWFRGLGPSLQGRAEPTLLGRVCIFGVRVQSRSKTNKTSSYASLLYIIVPNCMVVARVDKFEGNFKSF